MIEHDVEHPPKTAPLAFQVEYLEKVEHLKEIEKKLDKEEVREKVEREMAERFYARKQLEIEELKKLEDIDEYD